jgi:hypothetical protein
MTEDNAGEQPQKTVAELLAQHGAQADGGRRRRRRAVDDDDDVQPTPPSGGSRRKRDMSDTAPQAIIDRVKADTGTPLPPIRRNGGTRRAITPDAPPSPRPQTQQSGPFARPVPPPPQDSGQLPRPQDSGPLQRPVPPPPQDSGPLQRPVPPPPQDSGPLQRPVPPPPQDSGQVPLPPRGRGPRQQPPTGPGRIPAVRSRAAVPPPPPVPPPPSPGALSARLDGLDGAPEPEIAEQPPLNPEAMGSGTFAAPPNRPRRPPARRPAPPKVEDHTEQFAAVVDDAALKPEPLDEPPAPDAPPAGLASWRKRRQKAALDDTEVGVMPALPDVTEPDDALLDGGPPTRGFAPPPPFAPARATPSPGFAPAATNEGRLDLDDGFSLGTDGGDLDDEYDYDDEPLDEYDAELDDEPLDEYDGEAPDELEDAGLETSPAKQWLVLAGQLALGVVGGAAVWLGFNWLWVTLPAAALVVALLVVVGLVWIVRKIRRAEDLQTTVLAVLVGLVVTVSPAALLLVSR